MNIDLRGWVCAERVVNTICDRFEMTAEDGEVIIVFAV